jgi:eukaryotic-like serine/threonine-protein kinase
METGVGGLPVRLQPGERFAGKYLVERVLGTGGMGVVVAALHEQLRQTVAIKILSVPKDLQPEAASRFFREARATAALRSEHTARVIDVGIDELGRHFIVMEHLEGHDLGTLLKEGASRSIGTSVGYVLHACEAIAEAHALGIIHRDLKPENLFLTRRMDGSPLVKVLDFGVSKMLEEGAFRGPGNDPSVSASGSLVGTPLYMSPEQIRTPAAVDGRSDLWSLGVILYELLTDERPFLGETIADVIASILVDAPASPASLRAEVPEALSDLVLACLEKEVERRVVNVGVLAEGLRLWAPRWARDAVIRAARIAGGRQRVDDTGTHRTRETQSREYPAVPAGPPQPQLRPRTEILARPRQLDAGSGRLGRRLGWMALGFGVAITPAVLLTNFAPIVAGALRPEAAQTRQAQSTRPRASDLPPPFPEPLPGSSPAGSEPSAPTFAPPGGRAEVRAKLPATTGFPAAVLPSAELGPRERDPDSKLQPRGGPPARPGARRVAAPVGKSQHPRKETKEAMGTATPPRFKAEPTREAARSTAGGGPRGAAARPSDSDPLDTRR